MFRIISVLAAVVALGLFVVGCEDRPQRRRRSHRRGQSPSAAAEALPAGLCWRRAAGCEDGWG